ncbi:MAG: hypothetical protein OHK93_007379 [Ramalina farinacea]|uniref:DUF7924 domain-containing protein n=1 Tax=Ramalina farinacea TaxID=258253 RepID=A0AA43QPL2_9LECA|nr:hypothetical protein [Ramalina farinacea]
MLLRVLNETDLKPGRDWLDAKDHLWGRCEIDFLDDCMPPTRTGDAWLDKLTEQLPQVEVPRPHIAWGIYESAFTKTQKLILCNQANELAGPGLYDIFCVLEAKSMNYPLEAAENSCMRCGCAMVNTRRSLNRAPSPSAKELPASSLGFTSSPKPDEDSFAFSIAVGPQQARIFVNWALVYPADVVEWQMHLLRDYHFRRLDDIEQLHHDMDNIMEWGVTFRKQKVTELCGKIEEQGIVMEKPPSKKVEITEDESS